MARNPMMRISRYTRFLLTVPSSQARASSVGTRIRGPPGIAGQSRPSGAGPLLRPPWDGSRGWNCSRSAGRTGGRWTMTGVPSSPPTTAGRGLWTGDLRQEIPIHLQLPDLPVQAGDRSNVVPGPLLANYISGYPRGPAAEAYPEDQETLTQMVLTTKNRPSAFPPRGGRSSPVPNGTRG